MKMKPIACSEGVRIQCPSDGRVSFFNSPYPAHHAYAAVDLYPRRLFGEVAPSPVGGKVARIRRIMCPEGRWFESSSFDYLILIKSHENPDRLVKILHVEPIVEVGETVEPSQDLGFLLRSGYFNFWTEPHIHVEVRQASDPLRATGGFKIERSVEIVETEQAMELRGTVIEVKPEYCLISLDVASKEGMPADVGGHVVLLDAGLPHYGCIGIHANDTIPLGEAVRLCGKTIGTVKTAYRNMGLAECVDFSFRLGNHNVGLSLYLHLSPSPLVKIIPHKPGPLKIEKLEEVSLNIVYQSKSVAQNLKKA